MGKQGSRKRNKKSEWQEM